MMKVKGERIRSQEGSGVAGAVAKGRARSQEPRVKNQEEEVKAESILFPIPKSNIRHPNTSAIDIPNSAFS